MATQKPLLQLVPDILTHIVKYEEYTKFNHTLYWILEGQLQEEVEDALKREIISPAAFKRIKERIPPINVIRKVSDKLSDIYVQPPSRRFDKEADTKILEALVRTSCADEVLHAGLRLLVAQKMVAFEPYVHDRKQKIRVLGAHQCLPYSDDPINPNEMTVFIKMLGREDKNFVTKYDDEGVLLDRDEKEYKQLYALYSDTEFLVVDSGGLVRPELMNGSDGTHDFGRIPQVLVKSSNQELVPFPNRAGHDITVLIPKMLADLNYASQFLTHSLIWFRNTNLDGQEINPDAAIDLGSADREDGVPEIGVIKPEVDIDGMLSLINYQLVSYFDLEGMKVANSDILTNGRDSSAVGKAVDQADTTSIRKKNMEKMRKVEVDMWDAMFSAQRVWSNSGLVDERRVPSDNALDDLSVQYAEIRPVKTRRQLLDEIEIMRDLKLMTEEQAVKELRPELSEAQIKQWLSALEDEKEDTLDMLMKSSRNSGEFGEGNVAAGNPDTDPKDGNNDERA